MNSKNLYLVIRTSSLHLVLCLAMTIGLFSPLAYAELENFQAADVVIGQPDFSQGTANNGGRSAQTLNTPRSGFSDGKRLLVSDDNNHRVLIWNSIPTSSFAPADIVLGQPDLSQGTANNDGGVTARSLNIPRAVHFDGKRLFVADRNNHRILIWNSLPTTNFAPADIVLGQPNFNSSGANPGGISSKTISAPHDVFSDGKKLFVAEQDNNRVLIWNSIPTINFASADIVLGQPNFSTGTANNDGGTTARSLSAPRSVFSDGKRLFVVDANNNRVLIWNSIPTINFAPADIVIGQPNFNSNVADNGGRSASTLNLLDYVFTNGKMLCIADFNNHRVLIWRSIPTSHFAPADIVIGQPDFGQAAANNGGRSAQSLSFPRGCFFDGKRLFVGDRGNNRILIYNISGFTTQQDPQFEQGKAVVGKVFNDINGNGIQDKKEKGLEGIKIVSDTGIYAITDEDGKYHFPYIETGQRVLKLDPDTLPEGSTLTTDNPYKVTVTKGILTKVSFGVKLPEDHSPQTIDHSKELSHRLLTMDHGPLLNLSITQDTQKPIKKLGITAELKEDKILFTTTCNYFLFIKWSEIRLYDSAYNLKKTLKLPHPIPLYVDLPLKELPSLKKDKILYYQLHVYDAQGREDRTAPGRIELE